MNKLLWGFLLGCAAGVIDIAPMLIKKLPWSACLSAFLLWAVSGFLVGSSSLALSGILKGLLIPCLVLLPSLFIIGAKNPMDLLPILVMTLLLGGSLGLLMEKIPG